MKIIGIDRDRKRIGLSIRQTQGDPWMVKVEGIKEGQLVSATITHLTKFGAFARLDDDLEGLIHISELSEIRINHPKEVVKEGDVVTLRVIKIEPERRRIGLSLRKVDSPAYADLDWKIQLSDQVSSAAEETSEEAPVEAVEEIAAEMPAEAAEEVLEEAPEEASEEAAEETAE